MVASVTKSVPASPRQASRRRAAVDHRLDTGLFRALADPTRVRLLACLIKCGRPCSVSEVAECCEVDFSVVARHLGLLARAGVLAAEKRGRHVWYRVRWEETSTRLRALADAIDEWRPTAARVADCSEKVKTGRGCCPSEHRADCAR